MQRELSQLKLFLCKGQTPKFVFTTYNNYSQEIQNLSNMYKYLQFLKKLSPNKMNDQIMTHCA